MEVYARMRGIKLEGKGEARTREYLEKIGYHSFSGLDDKDFYETMVFECEDSDNPCCIKKIIVTEGEKEIKRYQTAKEAYEGHLKLCEKWSEELKDGSI